MIGLYWGRFNPPHKGHLELIKKLHNEVDNLIIAIGSAQEKDTKRNPFNGTERKQMIEAYLKEEKLDLRKIQIIPVSDGKSFSSSIKNLFELCGNFDVLYTDKESIIKLINKKVEIKKIQRTGTISSTKIRNAIANNEKWENLTGQSVIKLISEFDGVNRIKKTYEKRL